MSVQEDTLQGVRAVFVAVTGVAATQVIPADDKGPRPSKPYWTVKVLSANAGPDYSTERLNGLNGSTPTAAMRARREASISVQGLGTGAMDVLDDFVLNLSSPASLAAQRTAGVSLRRFSGPSDLAQFIDTAFEPRAVLELRGTYYLTGEAVDQVALTTAVVTGDAERYTGDPDPLPIDGSYS